MVREIRSADWSAIQDIYSALKNGELEQNQKSGRWSVIGGKKSYSTGTLVRMTEKFLEAIPETHSFSKGEVRDILTLLKEKGVTKSSDFSGTRHDLKLRVSKIADFLVPSRATNRLEEIERGITDFRNSLDGRLAGLERSWKELSGLISKIKTGYVYNTQRTIETGLPAYFHYDKTKIVGFKSKGATFPLPDFKDKQKLKEFLADDTHYNDLEDLFKSVGEDLARTQPEEGKALIDFSELLRLCKEELDNSQTRRL